MRTAKSTATFNHPFTLHKSVGELPGGKYEIELDEEEIGLARDRTAYRRVATYLYARQGASTRAIMFKTKALDAALDRDAKDSSHRPRN